MVDHVCSRVIIFVDRFLRESRRDRDGQQVLVLDIKSLSALCVGDVETVGLAEGASNVFYRPLICFDPHLVSIRGCIGLGQLPEHLVHKAFELFLVLTRDFMTEGDGVGCIEFSDALDAGWICGSCLHLLEVIVTVFKVHQ